MNGFESFIGINPWTALFILLNTLTIFFVAKKYLFGPVMKTARRRSTICTQTQTLPRLTPRLCAMSTS